MKRVGAIVGSLVLVATGGLAASAVAGKAPMSVLTHTTGHTGTDVTPPPPPTITTPRGKVILCHHTGSRKNPHRQITVSPSAVPAHLRHGDTLTPCPSTQSVTAHSRPAHVKKFHKHMTLRAELVKERKAAAQSKGKGKGKAKGRGR